MNPRSSGWRLVLALLVAFAGLSVTTQAEEPIEAVFFDLGDTLVESTGKGTFTLRSGAQATIDGLQDLRVQLGIITNVPAGWTRDDLEAILEEPELLDEFDVLVLSSQAPAPKPDPAIYTFAQQQLPVQIPIEHTAFVGETLGEIANAVDNPTEGARAVGMLGVHLSNDPPSPLADVTVPFDDLPQVVVLVEERNQILVDGFETGTTGRWDR